MIKLNDNGYPEVRKLTLRDRKKLTKILAKFAVRSGNEKLREMIPGVNKPDDDEQSQTASEKIYSLMESVMGSIIEWVEADVTAWFKELTGVESDEEWESLPFDIEVYVVEELYKQSGFENFFSKALGLYRKIQG